MEYHIRLECQDDSLEQALLSVFKHTSPNAVVPGACERLEAVVNELIGTKQHRQGPCPSAITHLALKETVHEAMKQGKPIPVLVPWGCSKQGPFGVDVAELMGLRQLRCLHTRVMAHYSPGVHFVVRLEDLVDLHLFADEPGWQEKTSKYAATFIRLHDMLLSDCSTILPESELMDTEQFRSLAASNSRFFLDVFTMPAEERGSAVRNRIPECRGEFPDDQLDHYRYVYAKFFPEDTVEQNEKRLADYIGGAVSRMLLRGTGERSPLDVILSFSPPIPTVKAPRRVFYRTIPERYTSQHRSPWIGKGYIRVRGREATPAIAGWNGDAHDYVPTTLTLADQHRVVSIAADRVMA